MTLPKTSSTTLTEEEWNELVALKEAITYRPASVSANKMEKFAELMVRSLEAKLWKTSTNTFKRMRIF